MPLTPHQNVLTNIANAIRAKDGTTAPIAGNNFATRIRMIPDAAYGQDDRKIFRFPNFLIPAQEEAQHLIRCDGRAAYAGRSQETYDLFKDSWLRYVTEIRSAWTTTGSPPTEVPFTPARAYSSFAVAGNKLYLGQSGATTTLLVIDTLKGTVKQITGLPNRVYNNLRAVGTKVYCIGGTTVFNSIVWIDTTTDTPHEISVANRIYNSFALVGNRLFIGTSTAATDLVFIDTDANTAGSVTGLTGLAWSSLFVFGTKLYVATSSQHGTIFVITGTTLTQITGLPTRTYNTWFATGIYLFASSSSAATSIVRINTTNDTFVEIGAATPLPSRVYNVFGVVLGTRIYIGSTSTSATSIVVINNAATPTWKEIGGLPQRTYQNFQLVGDKIYLGHLGPSSYTSIHVIDTNMDDWSEITGLPSRFYNVFLLNGTDLWLLSSAAATTVVWLNTNTDQWSQVSGLTSRAHEIPLQIGNRLYLGSASGDSATNTSFIPVIDLVNKTLITQIILPFTGRISGFPAQPQHRTTNILLLLNNKIYLPASSSAVSFLILTDSIMPHSVLPVYIKAGDYT